MQIKKLLFLMLTILLSVSTLVACTYTYAATATASAPAEPQAYESQSSLTIDRENNKLVSEEDEVRILQLTDIQFQTFFDMLLVFYEVEDMIRKTAPDLIVFTGDTLHNGGTEKLLSAFIDFMDEFKTPWAVVMGNHDYTSKVNMSIQCKMYEESEYCIFETGNLEGSNGNYYYTLQADDNDFYSLIFMDSGENGFSDKHTAWYESTVDALDGTPSILFYHIPIFEADDIYNNLADYKAIGSGELREKMCVQETSVGFFEQVLKSKSTTDMFFGHDHVNNAFTEYNGIGFYYGLKTGTNSYFDSDMQGGNLITVTTSGDVRVERIYN